jgi:hypothetical protein
MHLREVGLFGKPIKINQRSAAVISGQRTDMALKAY